MCGICGMRLSRPTGPEDLVALDRMNALLVHRGPDSSGSMASGQAALAMRRLSIIDLVGGDQPMWTPDGNQCIVYNGELYNFHELRQQLSTLGRPFRTRCDTEVVLEAYAEWGPHCLARLNGMFAIAIWDERDRTLFLARDRIGEKPLYYYSDEDRLIFASEIKAILAYPDVPRAVNPAGLANYLAYGHAVAPDTMYLGIRKLMPGHYLLAGPNGISVTQYWDVGDEPVLRPDEKLDLEGYAAHVRTLLDDSVHRRMISDVPIGAFLSGGVDSSAIVALMRRHSSGPVKTFSLGFSIGGAYDELNDARVVAEHFGTEHHELRVEDADLVDVIRTLVYHYDEPFGDAASFPLYLLSRFAREHVTVVLSGDGGDELFGGYRRYAVDRLAPYYQVLPRGFTSTLAPSLADALPRLRRVKRSLQALPIRDPAARYANWLTVFTPEMQEELLQHGALRGAVDWDVMAPYNRYYYGGDHWTARDHLNRLMYVDVKTWLADTYMEKTDKATMACSLEARLPILDHRLVELAFQIPGRDKIRGRDLKRVFKQAVAPLLPPEVLRRPKHGFAVPTDPWFRGQLRPFAHEILFDRRTERRGIFDTGTVQRLWDEHGSGRNVWDGQLWLLVNFELWARRYLDNDPA